MTPVLVIGAGITGASVAQFVGTKHATILEQEAYPGGKCRTYTVESPRGAFVFDIGGHWFHCQSHEKIRDLFSDLHSHTRHAYVYLHNKYINFPIQSHYHQLDDNEMIQSIKQDIASREHKLIQTETPYFDMLFKRYGPALYYLFFEPYNRKMFGSVDIEKIFTSPFEQLRNLPTGHAKGYNSSFYYTKNARGIQHLVDELLQGLDVQYQAKVVEIDMQAKRVILENGREYTYSVLINTMPLKTLLRCLYEDFADECAEQLQHSRGYIYNLGVVSDCWGDKNWVYFPQEDIPFYRLGSYSSVDYRMAPAGCHSLYMESTVELTKVEIAEQLQRLGIIHDSDDLVVMDTILLKENYCFYTPVLPRIDQWLRENGIYSIGRYGGWRWSSMHEDIFEAMQVADELNVNYGFRPVEVAGKCTVAKL